MILAKSILKEIGAVGDSVGYVTFKESFVVYCAQSYDYDSGSDSHDHDEHHDIDSCIECDIECDLDFDIMYENSLFDCCRDERNGHEYAPIENYHVEKHDYSDFRVEIIFDQSDNFSSFEQMGKGGKQKGFENDDEWINGYGYDNEYGIANASEYSESRGMTFELLLCAYCESDEYIYYGDNYPEIYNDYLDGEEVACCFDCGWFQDLAQELALINIAESEYPEIDVTLLGADILDQALSCACEVFNNHDNVGALLLNPDYEHFARNSSEIKVELFVDQSTNIESSESKQKGMPGYGEDLQEYELEMYDHGTPNSISTLSELSLIFCVKTDTMQREDYNHEQYTQEDNGRYVVDSYDQSIHSQDLLEINIDLTFESGLGEDDHNGKGKGKGKMGDFEHDQSLAIPSTNSHLDIDLSLTNEEWEYRDIEIAGHDSEKGLGGLSYDNESCLDCDNVLNLFYDTNGESPINEGIINLDDLLVYELLGGALDTFCCTFNHDNSIVVPDHYGQSVEYNHEEHKTGELKLEIEFDNNYNEGGKKASGFDSEWMMDYGQGGEQYNEELNIDIALCIETDSYINVYGVDYGDDYYGDNFQHNEYARDTYHLNFLYHNEESSNTSNGGDEDYWIINDMSESTSDNVRLEICLSAQQERFEHTSAGMGTQYEDDWNQYYEGDEECCCFDTEWYYDNFINRFDNQYERTIFDSDCFSCDDDTGDCDSGSMEYDNGLMVFDNGYYPTGDMYHEKHQTQDIQLALLLQTSNSIESTTSENQMYPSPMDYMMEMYYPEPEYAMTTTTYMEDETSIGLAIDVDCEHHSYNTVQLSEEMMPNIRSLSVSEEPNNNDEFCCVDCEWVNEVILDYSLFSLADYPAPCCVGFEVLHELITQAIENICCECTSEPVGDYASIPGIDSYEYSNHNRQNLNLALVIDSDFHINETTNLGNDMPYEAMYDLPMGMSSTMEYWENLDVIVELCINCESNEYGYYNFDESNEPIWEGKGPSYNEYDESCCELLKGCGWEPSVYIPELDVDEFDCELAEILLYDLLNDCGCIEYDTDVNDMYRNGEMNGDSLETCFAEPMWSEEDLEENDSWHHSFETNSVVICETCNSEDEGPTYEGEDIINGYETEYDITTTSAITLAACYVCESFDYTNYDEMMIEPVRVNGSVSTDDNMLLLEEHESGLEKLDLSFLVDVVGDFVECCCQEHELSIGEWVMTDSGHFSYNQYSSDHLDLHFDIETGFETSNNEGPEFLQITLQPLDIEPNNDNGLYEDSMNSNTSTDIDFELGLSLDCEHSEGGNIYYSGMEIEPIITQPGTSYFNLSDYIPQNELDSIDICCPDLSIIDGALTGLVDGLCQLCPDDPNWSPAYTQGNMVQGGYSQLGMVLTGAAQTNASASLSNMTGTYNRGFEVTHHTSFIASLVMCTNYEQNEYWNADYFGNGDYNDINWDTNGLGYNGDYVNECDVGCLMDFDLNLIEDIMFEALDSCCIEDYFLPPDIPYIGEIGSLYGYSNYGEFWSETEININLSIRIDVNEDGSSSYYLVDAYDDYVGEANTGHSYESNESLRLDFQLTINNESHYSFWENEMPMLPPRIAAQDESNDDVFNISLNDNNDTSIDLDPGESIIFEDVVDLRGTIPGLDLGDAINDWQQDGEDVVATLQNGATLTFESFGAIPVAGALPMLSDLQAELDNQNISIDFNV